MPKLNAKVNNKSEEIELVKTAEPKKKNTVKKTSDSKKKEKRPENNFEKIKSELKQVTWPTKKNMIKYSIATILMIVFLALFFVGISALFDFLYGIARGWIN